MSARTFQLQTATRIDRHTATEAVDRAVRAAGGWITDFRQFSNFAVVLELQIAPAAMPVLYAELEAAGLRLSPAIGELIVPSEQSEDIVGTLRLEFVHDEPDLKLVVPAVPG